RKIPGEFLSILEKIAIRALFLIIPDKPSSYLFFSPKFRVWNIGKFLIVLFTNVDILFPSLVVAYN
ncbi:hypothetical protein QUA70_28495, partial [Microcoleus sp. LAD1_D5]|uniref:hypothetical protein n=1 Tax=unclassified Microcoleus TaxID=2642155 RepID=UPI002FD0756B